jgi:serine phosphatase RsbU (regulator of sigma subunit)
LDQAAGAAKVVIDLIPPGALPPEAQAALANLKELPSLRELQDLQLSQLGKLGNLTGAALQETAKAMEQRAKEIERRIEEERRAARENRAARMQQWVERMKQGQPVDIPVRKEGRVVGTVNAEIDLRRVLDSLVAGRSRESGEIAFLIDKQNRLLVPGPRTRREKDRATLQSLDLIERVRESKAPVQTVSDDNWVVVARRDSSGIVIGIARPIGEGLSEIRRASARNLGLGMLAVFVALIGIVPISSRMTRNLNVLHSGVEKIASGDLSARVPVRSRDEIGSLSAAFNQMAQDLGAHQKLIAERERLRGELELCRQLQTEMLPKQPLRLGFAEIKGVSIPAREVGGDFFNYFLLPEGEVALLVGDVSGKGVGAALLMANVQATLRARLSLEHDLAPLADAIDHEIDASTPQAVYLTLFMGILDSSHHVLRYVNAGHNPQFVLRGDGGLVRLMSTGLPIAMFAGHGYREASVTLNEGDILFFYTDGITEVENEKGEMFGSDRLEALLVKHHEEGVDALLAHIEQEVLQFRGAADLFDDATMMVLRLGASKTA